MKVAWSTPWLRRFSGRRAGLALRYGAPLLLLATGGHAWVQCVGVPGAPMVLPCVLLKAVAAGERGELFVAGNGTIWRISGSSLVPVAGEAAPEGDAVAGRTEVDPWAIVGDGDGGVYFAVGNQVRRADRHGRISTVAGREEAGFSGDGGPAIRALLSRPCDLALDSDGCLLIKDADNARIRKVDGRGTISTVNWYAAAARSASPPARDRWMEIGRDERGRRYRFRRAASLMPRLDGPGEMVADGAAHPTPTWVALDSDSRPCFLEKARSDPPQTITLPTSVVRVSRAPGARPVAVPLVMTGPIQYCFMRVRRAERDGHIHTVLTGGGRLADSRGEAMP